MQVQNEQTGQVAVTWTSSTKFAHQVSATIGAVKAGDDGVATKLHGTVTSVAMLNSSSGSNPSYRVTVQLDATSRQLYDGSGPIS